MISLRSIPNTLFAINIMKSSYFLGIAIAFVCCLQASDALSSDQDKEVVCFVYHRFGDARYPSTNISKADFEAHLGFLVKNGFQVLSLSDAIAYLNSDRPPQKTVVITIDDGYKSFFTNGLPLLKKYGLPATLFINTETVGGNDYMSWSDLQDANGKNIEIGNHTHSHASFLSLPATDRYEIFGEELTLSQQLIEKQLHLRPRVFSYPYGEFDVKMENIVRQAGFNVAVAQNSGVIYSGTNLFACPRFPMSQSYASLDKFIEKTSMHALKVMRSSPENFSVPVDSRPLLSVVLRRDNLRLDAIQCFVHGDKCDVKIKDKSEETVTIVLQAVRSITGRRRTLYTLTVPDSKGEWHWYSHLWINPHVK